jgi:hypothetical protein
VVQLGWDGDIAKAYRIEIPNSSVYWAALDLTVAGDAVVIGGVASDDFNAPLTHWVARVL